MFQQTDQVSVEYENELASPSATEECNWQLFKLQEDCAVLSRHDSVTTLSVCSTNSHSPVLDHCKTSVSTKNDAVSLGTGEGRRRCFTGPTEMLRKIPCDPMPVRFSTLIPLSDKTKFQEPSNLLYQQYSNSPSFSLDLHVETHIDFHFAEEISRLRRQRRLLNTPSYIDTDDNVTPYLECTERNLVYAGLACLGSIGLYVLNGEITKRLQETEPPLKCPYLIIWISHIFHTFVIFPAIYLILATDIEIDEVDGAEYSGTAMMSGMWNSSFRSPPEDIELGCTNVFPFYLYSDRKLATFRPQHSTEALELSNLSSPINDDLTEDEYVRSRNRTAWKFNPVELLCSKLVSCVKKIDEYLNYHMEIHLDSLLFRVCCLCVIYQASAYLWAMALAAPNMSVGSVAAVFNTSPIWVLVCSTIFTLPSCCSNVAVAPPPQSAGEETDTILTPAHADSPSGISESTNLPNTYFNRIQTAYVEYAGKVSTRQHGNQNDVKANAPKFSSFASDDTQLPDVDVDIKQRQFFPSMPPTSKLQKPLCSCLAWLSDDILVQLLSITFAMFGVYVLSYDTRGSDGQVGSGIVMALSSAFLYALFEVRVKIDVMHSRSTAPVPFILFVVGLMGLVYFALLWPPILLLHLFDVERVVRTITLYQWFILCVNGVVITTFQLCLQVSLCFLPSPLLVSLASLLCTPAAQTADWFMKTGYLTTPTVMGSGLICISFLISVARETRKAGKATEEALLATYKLRVDN